MLTNSRNLKNSISINSIQPLPKNYIIFLAIWKLYIYQFYKRLVTGDQKSKKKIRKNLKNFSNAIQDPSIIFSLAILFVGFIQIFAEYTGLPIFSIFKKNLPLFNTNKLIHKWPTFHVSNSSYFIRTYPLSYQYQKVDIFKEKILIRLNSFYQNQQNQICFGFIPVNELNYPSMNSYYNFFSKRRISILIKPLKIESMDVIPNRMQAILKISPKQKFFPLFKKNQNISINTSKFLGNKQTKNTKSLLLQRQKQLKYNKLLFVTQNNQPLLWKKKAKFQKVPILKNKNIKKYVSRVKLKNYISKLYRNLFYESEYILPSLEIFCPSQPENTTKTYSNFYNLLEESLNYDDILTIIKNKELTFFYSNLNPRIFSDYWFPDINKTRKALFLAFKPYKLQVTTPLKYQSFLLQNFAQTIKKQKKILLKSTKFNFDRLHQNILYPHLQNSKFKVRQFKNYKKRLTSYKKTNLYENTNKFYLKNFLLKYYKPSSTTLGFKNNSFNEVRESLKPYSWLIITQVGFGIFSFKLFQYLYQEYGKEIILSLINFINLIGALPDAEWLINELNLNPYGRNFRAVRRVKKTFKQAAGITPLMVHFGDILWHLRSKKTIGAKFFHFFHYSPIKNRSFVLQPILLIGAPGTGKTLLVQALAGEAGVPVLLQSGSVLKDYRYRGKGARSIQSVFRRARQITPCIIFIDEIDSVGVRRESLSLNPMGEQDIMDTINEAGLTPISFEDIDTFHPKTKFKDLLEEEERLELDEVVNFGETLTEARQKNLLRIKVLQESQVEQHSRTEQLSILTQLLIELDGLTPLKNIMVLGATNRPYVLDPALLRPGRFYKIVTLKLPDHKKRINILKLYVSYMKQKMQIPWDYLSQRMEGLSAADISAIVNESALISICRNKKHTVKSLEDGFERITSYSTVKNLLNYKRKRNFVHSRLRSRWSNNSLFKKMHKFRKKRNLKNRSFFTASYIDDFIYSTQYKSFAYYQAGKSITQIFLPKHPSSVYFALQERTKNFRYVSMHGLILSLIDNFQFRAELEERLVGLLAGKASEFLPGYASLVPHLKNLPIFSNFNVSSKGSEDLQSATLLAFLMVEKWYFYAKRVCTQTHHPLLTNLNVYEFYHEEIKLFQAILEDLESEIDTQNRLVSILKTQKWSFRTWWQKQLIDEQSLFDKSIMDWYRIYLPEPEESERNIEWVPPDEYYTGFNIRLTNLVIYWHHFLKLVYDYLYHALILNSFNISFSFLNRNRELLDYLVDFVLRYEKVRSPQIQMLIRPFKNASSKLNDKIKTSHKRKVDMENFIIFKSWGKSSRRSFARILNFTELEEKANTDEDIKNFVSEEFQKLEIPKHLIKYPIIE